ncbi:hypothetical protein LCGC14_1333180 [marine sediment metagenome]|uniref:Uncharacterized protein n=1 Tax=marine sediment metagenome TaxID=412755 RepID=A0A0F9KGP1_9ZZZZ
MTNCPRCGSVKVVLDHANEEVEMPGKNNYHYAESTHDIDRTACDQPVGWLLVEQDEHTTDNKERFRNDPDACKQCIDMLGDP